MNSITEYQDSPSLDVFRTGEAYTVGQAAQLAGTTSSTVRRWLLGYEAAGRRISPVFGERGPREDEGPLVVSFLDLVEIAVVAGFRAANSARRRVGLDRLRRAYEFARRELGLPYPFATLQFLELGGYLLHEFDEREPGVGALAQAVGGGWVLPSPVQRERERLDFEPNDPYAVRWFPKGRAVPIVVDPRLAAGRPTIYRRGVTLETISRRWRAGEPMRAIAEDYELDLEVVEEALQYAA